MPPDYRIPQMLHSLGIIWYCPPLNNKIRRLELIDSGSPYEMQIRGTFHIPLLFPFLLSTCKNTPPMPSMPSR